MSTHTHTHTSGYTRMHVHILLQMDQLTAVTPHAVHYIFTIHCTHIALIALHVPCTYILYSFCIYIDAYCLWGLYLGYYVQLYGYIFFIYVYFICSYVLCLSWLSSNERGRAAAVDTAATNIYTYSLNIYIHRHSLLIAQAHIYVYCRYLFILYLMCT